MAFTSTLSMSINMPTASSPKTNGLNTTLRHAEKIELPLISKLFSEIIESSFPMFPDHAIKKYKESWTMEHLLVKHNTPSHALFCCAWHEGAPVGLVSGTQPELGVATIIWLLVKPDCQGQAIGSKLLEHARQFYQAQKCHKLKLTVPSQRACRFYVNNGMTQEGFHPSHWSKVDFWSLACPL